MENLAESVREQPAMPRFEDGSANLRELMRRIAEDVVSAIERLNREIRRRTRVVGTFPDGKSALMPVTARLKYVVENEWGRRRYLDISLLEEKEGRM
mgnify:FL=1